MSKFIHNSFLYIVRIPKHTLCHFAIAALLFCPLSAQTLKIFVLAGQSNMEGQAYTFDDPALSSQTVPTLEFLLSGTPASTNYLSNMPHTFTSSLAAGWINARTDAWCVHYDSQTGTTKDVQPTSSSASIFNGVGPLSPGFGVNTNRGSRIGAELAMGIRIADSTTDPIFLFKSDRGGTTLAEDWRPPSAVAARGGSLGPNYTNTVNQFSNFLDALDADLADDGIINNYGSATSYEICGLFWLQGFNESVENSGAFKPEYEANLVDFIHDIRVSDDRIPADLPLLIIESSDQDSVLNTGRANAVATINEEIPGSAAFFESNNMIEGKPGPVYWGDNVAGDPFSTGNGFHFHDRAENFLELGWIAGGAVLDNNWLTTSSFWLDRPTVSSVVFNGADVSTRANMVADTVTVYWDTVDHGPTTTGWANSSSLGAHAASAVIPSTLTASEDTTYFFRFHGTNTALTADFWTAPNTFSTPLEFPVPEMSDPVVNTTQPFGAAVQNTLLLADADVTLVWASSDQGASTVSAWTGASGGGSFSFGATATDDVLHHAISGLDPLSTYSFRFFASNANGDDWSEAGSFTTTENVSGLTNLGWGWVHAQNNGLLGGENLSHYISVVDGAAGWAGSDAAGTATSGTFGDGTVEAYAFFNMDAGADPGGGDGDESLNIYASGGTSITDTTAVGRIQSSNSAADIWTTTDPAGFTSTADFTNSTVAVGVLDSNWTGSINISTYSAGTIYFIYGHYRGGGGAAQDLDLTMKDDDALVSDINLLDAGSTDQPNNWEHYIVTIAFVNTEGYDKIDYDLDFNGNGRVTGIVVEGIPNAGPSSPFSAWSTSGTGDPATFGGDSNGDGVQDGIAFLLGASTPDQNVNALLPSVTEDGSGGLQMSFTMLKPAISAPSVMSIQHSGDLGIGDPWATVVVPSASGIIDGVNFSITENTSDSDKNDVIAIIPSAGNAGNGKLFGRLTGEE